VTEKFGEFSNVMNDPGVVDGENMTNTVHMVKSRRGTTNRRRRRRRRKGLHRRLQP
jgi:hypothetical protein